LYAIAFSDAIVYKSPMVCFTEIFDGQKKVLWTCKRTAGAGQERQIVLEFSGNFLGSCLSCSAGVTVTDTVRDIGIDKLSSLIVGSTYNTGLAARATISFTSLYTVNI
jgi:hypothetical protein